MIGAVEKKHKKRSLPEIDPKRKILFFLLILAFVLTPLVLVLSKNVHVEASWFNNNWTYRQKIAISGNSTDLTDYQVQITGVNTKALYDGGKLQRSCQDIRFTDYQGNLLDYWIEDDGSRPSGGNIALSSYGTVATARSSYNPYGGIGPAGAIDGNASTHWTSDGYYDGWYRGGEWLQVDLGSNKNFSKITWINNHGSNSIATEYNIEVSTNGTDWTEIVHITGNSQSTRTHTFTTQTARYVRMTGLQIVAYPTFALSEFQVFGPDLSSTGVDCSAKTSTDFWVRVPKLESEGTSIYMYYGNWLANKSENGSRTFEVFDTFNSSWYNANWNYRQKVTINASQISDASSSDLIDFPVYIDLSDLGADFFTKVKTDGSDIIVVTEDNTSKLARDLVSINVAGETGELWFKAPSLSNVADTVFYIYYGYTAASEANSTDTWSNGYRAIYHLNDGSDTSHVNDSTSNGFTLTKTAASQPNQVDALLGKGQDFGFAQSYSASRTPDVITSTDNITMDTWVKWGGPNGTNYEIVMGTGNGGSSGYHIFLNTTTHNISILMGGNAIATTSVQLTQNTWQHLVVTRAGGTWHIYLNGNELSILNNKTTSPNTPSGVTQLGGNVNGVLDNSYFASSARSLDWIRTEYTNQQFPSRFYSIYSPEAKNNESFSSLWEYSGSPQIVQGILELANATGTDALISKASYAIGKKLIYRASQSVATLDKGYMGFSNSAITSSFTSDDSAHYLLDSSAGSNFERETFNESTGTSGAGLKSEDASYHEFEIGWTSSAVNFRIDNSSDGSISTNIPNEDSFIRLELQNSSDILSVDWIAVTKYVASPPTTVNFGSEELGTNPIVYYKLDEGQGQQVINYGTMKNMSSIRGSQYGTDTYDPQWVDDCISGSCLGFDGSNSSTSYTNSFGDIANNFSYSVWVNPQKARTSTTESTSGSACGTGQSFAVMPSPGYTYATNHAGIGLSVGTNGITVCEHDYSHTPSTLVYNTTLTGWNHIALVMINKQPNIYLNGALVRTGLTSTEVAVHPSNGLGGEPDNTWGHYKGQIDEFKIFNRTLSQSEILAEYNRYSAVLGTSSDTTRSGLVARWKMDEGSWNGTAGEVLDSSGNGNNGRSYNGATTTGGNFGNAGNFDGTNDYVDIPLSTSLNINNAITLSSWVYVPSAVPTSTYLEVIAGDSNTSCNNPWSSWRLYIPPWTTPVQAPTLVVSNNVTDQHRTIEGGVSLPRNSWVHIAGTYDGYTGTVYMNGSMIAQETYPTFQAIGNPADIQLGESCSSYFNGRLNDTRIHNRALSGEEITELYNWKPEAVSTWKLDEKSGTIAYDSTVTALNGTLHGSMNDDNWINGNIGGGLELDGSNDYVSVVDNDALDILAAGSFTISTWFKTNGAITANSVLISKDGLVNSIGYTLYLNSTGQLVCGIDDDAITFPEDSVTSTAEYDNSTWYYATCVKNANSSLNLYVDGATVGTPDTAISATGSLANSTSLTFGGTTSSSYFNGQLDNVALYSYPMTQLEIYDDFQSMSGTSSGSMSGYATGQAVSDTNKEGHWMFEETSYPGTAGDVSDASVNNRDGTSLGTPGSLVGILGRSMIFDGANDEIRNIRPGPVKLSHTNYTISVWFKTTASSSGTIIQFANCNTGGCGSGHTMIGWRNTNGNFAIADYASANHRYVDTTSTYRDGRWHHVSMVLDTVSLKLYMDGVYYGENTAVNSTNDGLLGTNYMYIGGRGRNTASDMDNLAYFNGALDDFRVYSRALSDKEIFSLYNSSSLDLAVSTEKMGGSADSLVGHYDFNNKSGTIAYDNAIYSQNGTLTNMDASDWVEGKIGNGLDFDGTDDVVVVPQSSFINLTGKTAYAVSAWINPGSDGEGDAGQIWNKGSSYLRVSNESGGIVLVGGLLDLATADASVTTTATIPLNSWSHVVMTYIDDADDEIEMYINGALSATSTNGNGSLVTESNQTNIGGGTGANFDGVIDNLKIWTSGLTGRDVAVEYNGGAPIGWWKMDRGEGNTAYDYAGNDNHGTMMNMDATTDWLSEEDCAVGGSCLSFDGQNDNATVPDAAAFDFGNEMSISLWVKPGTTQVQYTDILSKHGTNNTGFAIEQYSNNTNVYRFSWANGTTYTCNSASDNFTLTPNVWQSLIIIKSGNVAKYYINGILVKTCNGAFTTVASNDYPFLIGKWAQFDERYFNGNIDDIKLFTYALSEEDIKIEYNKGSALRFE